MKTVNIHEAKTHLSRLLEGVAESGEPFVIAKAGKPIARVVPIEAEARPRPSRLGFMAGEFTVPDDIKTPFEKDISEMFYGSDE